jgi:hypothetical protein
LARDLRHPRARGLRLALSLLLLALPRLAAAAGVEDAWLETRWGESSDEIAGHFGARATRLQKPLDFGDSFADVVLRKETLGGYPVVVYFQMDKSTRGLKRVQVERQRHGVTPKVARAILDALVEAYGEPDKFCFAPPSPLTGYQNTAERQWLRGGAAIRLVLRDMSVELSEGCPFGDLGVLAACGPLGQILVRVTPPSAEPPPCP